MNFNIQFLLMEIYCCCVLWAAAQPASGQQLPENSENLELYELDRAADALVPDGFTAADRAEAFVGWMAANDWSTLNINSLYNLYEWVSLDSLDSRHFSARWNGFITAPVTGAYTLKQTRVYMGVDCRLKVMIDGQVVLDSANGAMDGSRFTSNPVHLTAGQAVAIQVELVHDVNRAPPIVDFGEDAPMALLTWTLNQGDEHIIPTTAYTPPSGFAEAGSHGLKGQYFGNTQFGELRVTRLVPALDLVWSLPPVSSIYQEDANAVLNACKTKLLNADFLAQCAEDQPKVLSYNLWRFAHRMTGTERQRLVEILKDKPDILAAMTSGAMGRLTQAIYMLPGNANIELLGEWALARRQPHCSAGIFPGWGMGRYQTFNTDYYWLMGRFMQGPYANDAETLCDQYLERPDGECNLSVAYAAAYASRLKDSSDEFFAKLDERINDQSVTGDKLMTWLVARAFARGTKPGNPRPLAGFSDLESAFIVAEGNGHKFWALQEMVSRLSSVNKGERAKALIEENRAQFTTPQQQAAMEKWIIKADELAEHYAKHKVDQAQATSTAYKNALERRRQSAIERGDSAAASRFGELISSAESSPEN